MTIKKVSTGISEKDCKFYLRIVGAVSVLALALALAGMIAIMSNYKKVWRDDINHQWMQELNRRGLIEMNKDGGFNWKSLDR
jgi:hypothetical protein